jgi:hypothetical protein
MAESTTPLLLGQGSGEELCHSLPCHQNLPCRKQHMGSSSGLGLVGVHPRTQLPLRELFAINSRFDGWPLNSAQLGLGNFGTHPAGLLFGDARHRTLPLSRRDQKYPAGRRNLGENDKSTYLRR